MKDKEMSDISEMSDSSFLKKSTQQLKPKQKRVSQEDVNAKAKKSISPTDEVHVAPMQKWVQMLHEMPDPELSEEEVAAFRSDLPYDVNSDKFQNEVLPTLVNELTRDWNVSFREGD